MDTLPALHVAPSTPPGAHRRAPWTREAIRIAIAVLVAGFVGAVAFAIAQGPFDVRTDVIGYPTFHNFDYRRTTLVYQVLALVVPAVFLVAYFALGRLPALRRSAEVASEPSTPPRREEGRPSDLGVVARVGLTAAAVGIELAVITRSPDVAATFVGGGLVFALGVVGVAVLLHRGTGWSWVDAVAVVSALSTPIPVLGLYAVSRRTQVTILTDGAAVEYEWLPLVVAVALTASVAAWVMRSLLGARRQPDISRRFRCIERTSVLLVSGSVLVFMFSAQLPGTLGPLDAFHEGEGLGLITSMRAGELPWRDSIGLHGLFGDYIQPAVGLAVFEDSRWGAVAGQGIILYPLAWVALWWGMVRFLSAAWPVLVVGLALILFGPGVVGLPVWELGYFQVRFLALPVVLVLLAVAIDRRSAPLAAATGMAAAVQFILAPEMGYLVLAVGLVVVAYDVTRRVAGTRHGAPLISVWVAAGGLTAMGVLWVVLALLGILDDWVAYFTTFASGHELTGTHEVAWSDPFVGLPSVIGIPAVAVGFVLVMALGRWRRADGNDWAMLAAATLSLLYFRKFLARPDSGHLLQVISASSLLFLYVAASIVRVPTAWWRSWSRDDEERRRAGPLLAGASLAVLLTVVVAPPGAALAAVGPHFSAYAAEPASDLRLGYSLPPADDPTIVADLRDVLTEAQLGPNDVFDFTNSPALFYYLLPFESPSKFIHVSMAIRGHSQRELIEELEADSPAVVAYDSGYLGLPAWDGIINSVRHHQVSAWILDHYRPWISVHGYALWQRNDLDLPRPTDFGPEPERLVLSSDLQFAGRVCDWGATPTFASWDVPGGSGPVATGPEVERLVTIGGWSSSSADDVPIERVVVRTDDGTVVGTGTATGNRPDLALDLGLDQWVVPVGFRLTVGLARGERVEDLRVTFERADGEENEAAAAVATGAGPVASYGIEEVSEQPVDASESVTQRVTSPGRQARWITSDSATGTVPGGNYALSDQAGPETSRSITWRVPDGGRPGPLGVPIASCPQWTGETDVLYLTQPTESSAVLSFAP